MAVIRGSAFLWHQVRCMMTVLFLIGNREEPIEIIDDLLDPNLLSNRPNFDFAEGINLILSECGFKDIVW